MGLKERPRTVGGDQPLIESLRYLNHRIAQLEKDKREQRARSSARFSELAAESRELRASLQELHEKLHRQTQQLTAMKATLNVQAQEEKRRPTFHHSLNSFGISPWAYGMMKPPATSLNSSERLQIPLSVTPPAAASTASESTSPTRPSGATDDSEAISVSDDEEMD